IVEEAIDKKKTETEPQNNLDPSSEFERDIPGGSKQLASPEGEQKDSQDEMEKARKTFFDALKELKENIAGGKDKRSPQEEQRADGIPQVDVNDDNPDDSSQKPKSSQMVYGSKSRKAGEDDETWIGSGKRNKEVAENVKIIMKALEGHIQRNIALDAPHPGGLPRRWKRMNYFDELEDIDPFEAMFWSEYTSPSLPRVHKREKEMLGGEIAILRDVSTSMMGVYSEWSSSVVRGVIEVAKAKRMRVGYIEFNHKSYKYRKNSKFFTRDYPWILDRASRTECSGNTNYEDALKDALNEFRGRGLRNKHILFITDGIPTSGDCEVSNERLRAKKLGVCIHSI
ncbi:MAG: vWA domain-containing protein, partial [Candidatus Caldarchaeum sp.]